MSGVRDGGSKDGGDLKRVLFNVLACFSRTDVRLLIGNFSGDDAARRISCGISRKSFGLGNIKLPRRIYVFMCCLRSHAYIFSMRNGQLDFGYYPSLQAVVESAVRGRSSASILRERQFQHRAFGFGWDSEGSGFQSGRPHLIVPDWFFIALITLPALPWFVDRYRNRASRLVRPLQEFVEYEHACYAAALSGVWNGGVGERGGFELTQWRSYFPSCCACCSLSIWAC